MMQEETQITQQELTNGLMAAQILGGTFEPGIYTQAQSRTPLQEQMGTGLRQFRGRLEVSGLKSNLPEQEFTVSTTPTGLVIEGEHSSLWPHIKVDLTVDSLVVVRKINLQSHPKIRAASRISRFTLTAIIMERVSLADILSTAENG